VWLRDGRVCIRPRRDLGNSVPRRKEEKGRKILISVVGVLQLALGYGLRNKAKKKEEKRRSVNCAEDAWTEIGSKWPKKQKRRSEVRENEPLDEKIEETNQARKMDRGQLNKRKNPPMDTLEHFAGKKERQAGEAWKTWVKLT
jgi:hypothetical protein